MGRSDSLDCEEIIIIVWSGGSSRALSSAFCACIVRSCASSSMTAFIGLLIGLRKSFFCMCLISSIPMVFIFCFIAVSFSMIVISSLSILSSRQYFWMYFRRLDLSVEIIMKLVIDSNKYKVLSGKYKDVGDFSLDLAGGIFYYRCNA